MNQSGKDQPASPEVTVRVCNTTLFAGPAADAGAEDFAAALGAADELEDVDAVPAPVGELSFFALPPIAVPITIPTTRATAAISGVFHRGRDRADAIVGGCW